MAANQSGSSTRRRRVLGWCAVGVGVALVILAFVPLEKADQAASVGSFFVGAGMAISGGLAAATSRRSDSDGAVGGPKTWHVDQVIQAAGADGYQVGGDNIDQRGAWNFHHSGISFDDFRRYQDSVLPPLRELIDRATRSYERLEWKLRLTVWGGAIALICALVVGVLFGKQLSESPPIPQASGQSTPTVRPPVTPPATLADDVNLENQVNKFFADFYAETRDGGLSKVEVVNRYFAASFKWFREDTTDDHQTFANGRKAEGAPQADGCKYLATVASKVDDKGDKIVVAAVVVWTRPSDQRKGTIDVIYTLKRESKGKPFRISVVAEPRTQKGC